MKHLCRLIPPSFSPPRWWVRMSSRAVCTRLSQRARLSSALPVPLRSSHICPSGPLVVYVVGLGLVLVLVRWWWWSLVLV